MPGAQARALKGEGVQVVGPGEVLPSNRSNVIIRSGGGRMVGGKVIKTGMKQLSRREGAHMDQGKVI